jgi:hypothetical protein
LNTKLLVIAGVVLAVLAGIGVVVLHRTRAPHEVTVAPAAPVASPRPPASCLLPGPPPVPPNGAVASAADMRLGHDVMQSFVLQLEAYQACRNAQADHAAPGVSQAQKDAWIAQGNDAIDEANALAASFGAQLKVFKARTPGK